ncbi:MAG TPA: tail fiber protein [Solirubrobacteraceae bacterium]|nr:tail fiber protein [Solirubrobacteraceae bacterium]
MATPYLGEIKIFTFTYAPRGWALCNGQLIAISQNQALFSLLGTTYGGDGRQTFALPNLQGRVPAHVGAGFLLGAPGGEETHTVTAAEMAGHTHALVGSPAAATATLPTGNYLATASGADPYGPSAASDVPLIAGSFTAAGGSGPHENRQPYLVLSACIALTGIYPPRN